jgi:hypothetical protein
VNEPLWFDRKGQPITDIEAVERQLRDPAYKRIDETTLPDGKWISTVWLGLNHRFGEGPPLIFETMVFDSQDNLESIEQERYSTEEDAIIGHQQMIAKYTKQNPIS